MSVWNDALPSPQVLPVPGVLCNEESSNSAGQAANHGALLREMADAVAAFVDDLRRDKLLDRALVMTFSEFGLASARLS